MADRPILFSGPMVRAILDGKKTQTRRVLTRRNTLFNGRAWPFEVTVSDCDWTNAFVDPGPSPAGNNGPYIKVRWPYGRIYDGGTDETLVARVYPNIAAGDRLWVRETWFDPQMDGGSVLYAADAPDIHPIHMKRPSIFMPRWASRITLVVENVRVQRLQDISEADAEAEGASPVLVPPDGGGCPHVEGFRDLWNSLNAKRGYGWEMDPWVVAVTFRRVFKNIGEA